jgi:transcriptional regulator with XRE-family HTH domain
MLTRQPPPPDFEWTAESIRALRSHLGQSQAALSRELGIRQQTVSEWETGMYRPRGASITILTLLAVSSGFQFDLPKAKEVVRDQAAPKQQHNRNGNSSRPTAVTAPREIKGPRTHPDWVRTNAISTDASSTRNFIRPDRNSKRIVGYRDGEIPM